MGKTENGKRERRWIRIRDEPAKALVSALDELDRQEDEELIAAAAATEGRKLASAGRGKGRHLEIWRWRWGEGWGWVVFEEGRMGLGDD